MEKIRLLRMPRPLILIVGVMIASVTLSVASGQEISLELANVPKCTGQSEENQGQVPGLFVPEWQCPGFTLYRHESEFVQVIELDQGGSLYLLGGEVVESRLGEGAYGGDDPQLKRQTVAEAWQGFRELVPEGVCLTNGQFFRNDQNVATGLAFPVKHEGSFSSDGYAGETEYAGEKLILEIWSNFVQMQPFTPAVMASSTAPQLIVGLMPMANKDPERETGRTFMGIQDRDGDQRSETVLILTAKAVTQGRATEILEDFGADQVMMLDGGGSSQLFCQDTFYLESPRRVPQMIGAGRKINN